MAFWMSSPPFTLTKLQLLGKPCPRHGFNLDFAHFIVRASKLNKPLYNHSSKPRCRQWSPLPSFSLSSFSPFLIPSAGKMSGYQVKIDRLIKRWEGKKASDTEVRFQYPAISAHDIFSPPHDNRLSNSTRRRWNATQSAWFPPT